VTFSLQRSSAHERSLAGALGASSADPAANGPARSQRPAGDGGESIDAPLAVDFVHRLRFTRGAFEPANRVLSDILAAADSPATRILPVIDEGLLAHWPDLPRLIREYARSHARVMRLAEDIVTIPGGETCKNDRTAFERILQAIHTARICRQSFVLAIGGGAVLDVAGFAAATAHRGVRLIRMPTTTLAQGDSGVGVKNGINAFGKKNFIGTFAPPWAVINDETFLASLSERDWRCGAAEAVKVALVKDAAFFEEIARVAPLLRQRDQPAMSAVVARSARLHLQHITSGGDPFELTQARPLDFGHWAAHKLEQMTRFELRHGEAVAMGVALDSVCSTIRGWLAPTELQRILAVLRTLGFELFHPAMRDAAQLLSGLEEFREHLGGRLTLTMLRGIGEGFDVHGWDGGAADDRGDGGPPDRRTLADAVDRLASDGSTMG